MDSFYSMLDKRRVEIGKQIDFLQGIIKSAPSGRLRVSNQRGKKRYYSVQDNCKRQGVYISDKKLLQGLSFKENAIAAMHELSQEFEDISRILNRNSMGQVELLPNSIKYNGQMLPIPDYREILRQDYINKWLSKKYPPSIFGPDDSEIYSMSGLRVRSKSEAMIVDCLEAKKIPFHYEVPIFVDGEWLFPDFQCLHPYRLEEIYWGHWGSMDDPKYVDRQLYRVQKLRSKGIILGKNLFLTMETRNKPLNVYTINQFIDDYLS